jgi:hypothetical protein
MVLVSNLCLLGVNGGVVHGRGFETWGVKGGVVAWSWFPIFDFLGGQCQRIGIYGSNRRIHIEKQRRLSFARHTNHARISCRC